LYLSIKKNESKEFALKKCKIRIEIPLFALRVINLSIGKYVQLLLKDIEISVKEADVQNQS